LPGDQHQSEQQHNAIMPQEIQITRSSEFIRFGAHGHFDLAASKAALA
jgi:hypothetical protein